MIEDAERTLVQLGEGNVAHLVLALDIADVAVDAAIVLDDLDEGRGFAHQRASSLI